MIKTQLLPLETVRPTLGEGRDVRKKVNDYSEKGQARHGLGVKSSLFRFFPIKPFLLPESA